MVTHDVSIVLLLSFLQGVCAGVTRVFNFAVSAPTLIGWFRRHGDAVTIPIADEFITSLKASAGVKRIACVGYCWGGRYALLQAAKSGLIAAVSVAHPSFVSVPGDIDAIACPAQFILAEKDDVFPPSAVAATKEILGKKSASIASEFHSWPGTVHGFAVRGNEQDPVVAKARGEALERTAAFFAKQLAL